MVTPALAHAPLLDCGLSGNGAYTCQAGYSDGSSAANQIIRVRDANHRLVLEERFNANGSFTFDRPDGEFHVEFEGDPLHSIVIYVTD
jgi:hypothetical protein